MKALHVSLALLLMVQTTQAQVIRRRLQWIGGPTMVLQLGNFTILTDPMLSPAGDSAFIIPSHPTTGEKNAPIKRFIGPADFDKQGIDLLLLSHAHADHIDKEAKAQLPKNIHLVAPAVNKEQISAWGFTHITGLNWTDTMIMHKGDESLMIIAVEAHHAANDPLKTQLGKVNGYIITYRHGKDIYRIYWTGDNVWFDEIAGYIRYGHLDLLIPDMGSVGSDGPIGRRGLNAQDCLKIARALDPGEIIPVHHTTFSMYIEPIAVLKATMDTTVFRDRLQVLATGETAVLK